MAITVSGLVEEFRWNRRNLRDKVVLTCEYQIAACNRGQTRRNVLHIGSQTIRVVIRLWSLEMRTPSSDCKVTVNVSIPIAVAGFSPKLNFMWRKPAASYHHCRIRVGFVNAVAGAAAGGPLRRYPRAVVGFFNKASLGNTTAVQSPVFASLGAHLSFLGKQLYLYCRHLVLWYSWSDETTLSADC